MESPRVVGHIVSVHGFQVKVELLPEAKSPSRATLDGVQTAVAINAYLAFGIGAGLYVIGIITDLEARESYDPTSGHELTLELLKARRVATVQLLGTVEKAHDKWTFDPGITVLPTLDTQAEIGSPTLLAAIFANPPKRNRPDGYEEDNFDCELDIGSPTGQRNNRIKASYNDIFSRHLAIVGNTGSGKSYTVASLIQQAMTILGREAPNEPHVFILDINGEYARAFLASSDTPAQRVPDSIYLNGTEFGIPIWFFNAEEIRAWLSASEQTQEPVLKDWWAIAKARHTTGYSASQDNSLRYALIKIEALIECLDGNQPVKKTATRLFALAASYWGDQQIEGVSTLTEALQPHIAQKDAAKNNIDWDKPANERAIREAAYNVQTSLKKMISENMAGGEDSASTADTPLFIARSDLIDPTLIDRAVSQEDASRIETHLTTLKLRLKTRLDDKRWKAFLNYEDTQTKIDSLPTWFERFGFRGENAPKVSIIDFSMLSYEVLPYACGVVGRILLEARERLPAAIRFRNPWVLVLEEAHNYARPRRESEDRGQTLSRTAFERIAKEGRKFGISLIVASQRPSEISPTIISQCANFFSHRLQNPDDIDHFRRIIPLQARRLLDQVTVLASGEAIVFGSAFHLPTRAQIDKPNPPPWSQTAAPYHEWRTRTDGFPIETVMQSWGLDQSRGKSYQAEDISSTISESEQDDGAAK